MSPYADSTPTNHVTNAGVDVDGPRTRRPTSRTNRAVLAAMMTVAVTGGLASSLVTSSSAFAAVPTERLVTQTTQKATYPQASTAADTAAKSSGNAAPLDESQRPDPREPLTPAQVKREVAEAERLRAQLAAENAAAAEAANKLDAASLASASAMETLANTRRALAEATAAEETQRTKLRQLTASVNKAKKDVDHMAVDAYTSGTDSLSSVAAMMKVLTGSSDELSNAALAAYLADSRDADRSKYADLAKQQQQVAAEAAKARLAREKAAAQAAEAKQKADVLVAEHTSALTALQQAAAGTAANISDSEAAIAEGQRAEAQRKAAAERAAAAAQAQPPAQPAQRAAAATALSAGEATCADDKGYYPNGQYPASALCTLETAPNHMLRPGAAEAFDAMSRAYQKDTGNLLCITDSYRSLASQIDVRSRKPTLAAVPGTSNHGLGLAVDLCGGVESFGTPAFSWMQRNAPMYGFFHPAWAGATGSKPEPWHWEFAG